MIKRIITEVSCIEDWAEGPESFYAEIDEEFAQRILMLSGNVESLGIYGTCEFSYRGTWSTALIEVDETDITSEEQLKALIAEIELDANDFRVDIPMLHVMTNEFKWTAVPKHCGDNMEIRSRTIPLEFLSNDEPLFWEVE